MNDNSNPGTVRNRAAFAAVALSATLVVLLGIDTLAAHDGESAQVLAAPAPIVLAARQAGPRVRAMSPVCR